MTNAPTLFTPDYWSSFKPEKADIDFIINYLFEKEIPLAKEEILPILIDERIRVETEVARKKRQGESKIYLPANQYKIGDNLGFPALNWKKGKVVRTRPGVNPSMGEFDVIDVELEDGAQMSFASRLEGHKLNHAPEIEHEDGALNAMAILTDHGEELETAIVKGLRADKNLVQIAGRWFPRSLLVDVNIGHLNLAEAILDEAGGKPLSPSAIVEQVGIPDLDNPNLIEFSMNFALQEDDRFDEVGPAGEVLWCLKRLEPEDVQQIPVPLRYTEIPYDRNNLTDEMLALESEIDDELSGSKTIPQGYDEITICLTYPHWRSGTLPISYRTRPFFPTAYESERVRFSFVDSQSKEEMPAWVVRQHGYVAGLGDFYGKFELIPGSLVTLRKSQKKGQLIIEAHTHRPRRDWVRTVLVGSDGGIVFANLKQNVTAEFNERMVVAVPDINGVDAACDQLTKKRVPYEKLVADMMKELTKLNVQGHIHAQELYSAINIVRRCPIGPLLTHLSQSPAYKHVGDMHFRLNEKEAEGE